MTDTTPRTSRIDQLIVYVERMRSPDIVRPDEEASLRHIASLIEDEARQQGLPSVEGLAEAMYEDMRATYRDLRRAPPSWIAMLADPSGWYTPKGGSRSATHHSVMDGWRRSARRIHNRLVALSPGATTGDGAMRTLRELLIEALLTTDAAPDPEDAENIADDIIGTPAGRQIETALHSLCIPDHGDEVHAWDSPEPPQSQEGT